MTPWLDPQTHAPLPECDTPPIGWQMPVAMCHDPFPLIANLRGKMVNHPVFCRARPGVVMKDGQSAAKFIQEWRIVRVEQRFPEKTLLEFQGWIYEAPEHVDRIRAAAEGK